MKSVSPTKSPPSAFGGALPQVSENAVLPTYLVIGDDAATDDNIGVIEAVIPLTGLTIPSDGVFVAAEDTLTIDGVIPDLTTVLNFEEARSICRNSRAFPLGTAASTDRSPTATEGSLAKIRQFQPPRPAGLPPRPWIGPVE